MVEFDPPLSTELLRDFDVSMWKEWTKWNPAAVNCLGVEPQATFRLGPVETTVSREKYYGMDILSKETIQELLETASAKIQPGMTHTSNWTTSLIDIHPARRRGFTRRD